MRSTLVLLLLLYSTPSLVSQGSRPVAAFVRSQLQLSSRSGARTVRHSNACFHRSSRHSTPPHRDCVMHATRDSREAMDSAIAKATTKAKRKSSPKRTKVKGSDATDKKPDDDRASRLKGSELSYKERLARAAETLLAERNQNEAKKANSSKRLTMASLSAAKAAGAKRQNPSFWTSSTEENEVVQENASDVLTIMDKINQKLMSNDWTKSGQKPIQFNNENKLYDRQKNVHTHHSTDSMQSLLGYNHYGGEWNDRNATTYHVAIVFGKPLIQDQVTVEYATRIRTLVKLLKEEPNFCPKLICFTGGTASQGNLISDASAGYVYFRHLCASQNVTIDSLTTKIWVDTKSSNEREAMERIASELWRNHIKQWLSERPLVERMNQHYGVGWKILERKVDIHFTLVSTEYHLCNLNDVHHRSPLKSFLQPLVSLRGLAGSDRWENNQELEVMDPNYSTSVHVKGSSKAPVVSERSTFGGIENSVDTSWSFQYGTYPFLHGHDDAIVFLGQCYLLGEELTPLLVNMKGVVEQTEFFQRDNYYLLSSIRRSLVTLVESLYTEKGQFIRLGVINHFDSQGRNRLTKEDVKIIVVLESALLNLGRCIDLVKPAGLLVSSVPANTWSRALDALQKSMHHIQTVCDPDQPLDPAEWGKLFYDEHEAKT